VASTSVNERADLADLVLSVLIQNRR